MSWWTPCGGAPRRGRGSGSTCGMSPKNYGHHKRLRILMMIRRANGESGGRERKSQPGSNARRSRNLSPLRKNCREFLRRYHLELGVGAVTRFFVGSPAPKLRRMTETVTLHVVVSNLHHELRTQRLPRQVFSLTPAALTARHPFHFATLRSLLRPMSPGVIGECVPPVGLQEFHQLLPFFRAEAGTNTDVLQFALFVEQAQQQG